VLTMQDALIRLTEYWSSNGCVITQPMNTEVGAGTLNPATALRVLGPEPWRVAYVEPSVRPADSRYGDNPNRLQTHTQFQVILKPEPADAQELYLSSLAALGIDLGRNDVRFVEDDWASPALGAWGLGWEVWLNGLEITQFTYFQQSGGFNLDPVSVELTYGMERIIIALQGVTHFKDITYAPGISYGEAFGQAEYEMSRYYLDDADIDTNRALFEAYEGEARRLTAARLPVPAHGYVLKCSHVFNVLDARGVIGATERARAFARMRTLAHEVSKLWIQRREELGYPLGVATAAVPEPLGPDAWPRLSAPAPVAIEVGVEELPPSEVPRTADAVLQALTERLAATRLRHGDIRVVASPRRVVALVDQVEPQEEGYDETVRGPRLSVAYDAAGNPTRAALGFARSQGVDVVDLQRIMVDGGEYLGTVRRVAGRPAAQVLSEMLGAVFAELRAEKNMRWNAPGLSFARPIRWILALLGEHVVPFSVSTLVSGRTTRVHHAAAQPVVQVASAEGYLDTLAAHGIIADGEVRRRQIMQATAELAATVGGTFDADGEREVVDEVTNLVEEPTPILGEFDRNYLELPDEVLTTVMKKHQRYLPVRDQAGRLLPFFVAVANGRCDAQAVRAGNQAVLRARYEDARFFWRNDLRTPPEQLKQGLSKLTFEERLGSMADRAARIAVIAEQFGERVELSDQERAVLVRAGRLAKFDLASEMVIELPSLAGVMAREYARRAGEPEAVAQALLEMELPRHAGDALPTSLPGALLALADRLDLLAGLFAVGSIPTGSSDPFGLRRAALGVTGILRSDDRLAAISLTNGLAVAARHQPVVVGEEARAEVFQFVVRRLEQQLLDAGYEVGVVRAVLPLADQPRRAEQTAAELTKLSGDPHFHAVVTTIQRVSRIARDGVAAAYDPNLFQAPAERRLHEAITKVHADLAAGYGSLGAYLAIVGGLAEPVDTFFDEVFVMTEDPAIRLNRLGLLAAVRDLGAGVLDWEALAS
jgi:glycyl-tRNA synthetase